MKKIAVAGILVLVSISTLFRGLYFSYETYGFLAALAALSVLYFFGKMVKNEPVHLNKLFVLLGVFMLTAVSLSFIKAVNPRENLGLLLLYAELLIIFFVLYDYFHDKKQQFIQTVMLLVMLTGFVCAVVGLMALTGRFSIWDVSSYGGNRLGSTFQYANTASIYFAVCCMFSITIVDVSKNILLKAMAVGMGCIYLYAFLLTGSRGGYIVGTASILLLLAILPSGRRLNGLVCFLCMTVPVLITIKGFNVSTEVYDNAGTAKWLVLSFLIAALSFMLFCLLRKAIMGNRQFTMTKGVGFILVIALMASFILAFVFRSSIVSLLPPVLTRRIASFTLASGSVLSRLEFNKDALKLLADHWLFGLGGGGWKALYQSIQDYFYTAVFVHNNYLQVFVESGILGILSYMAIVLLTAINAFNTFLKARSEVLKTYTAGLLCGFLALLFHSSIDFDLSYGSLALLFWVMFAASAVRLPDEAGVSKGVSTDSEAGVSNNEGINSRVKGRFLFHSKWDTVICCGTGKIVLIAISAVLFSIHALYFAGAVNRQIAFDSMQKKNYSKALVYYEEAYRLDPSNSSYAFELAKLYHFYAGNSKIEENRQIWLEKARATAEKSVYENKGYPAHIGTLVMIYLDSGMPLQALEYAQNLVSYQKYYVANYELLARSYLAAADYYEKKGDIAKVKELLIRCTEIDNDPYLRRSGIIKPNEVNSEKKISEYKHSEELMEYLNEAEDRLKGYK